MLVRWNLRSVSFRTIFSLPIFWGKLLLLVLCLRLKLEMYSQNISASPSSSSSSSMGSPIFERNFLLLRNSRKYRNFKLEEFDLVLKSLLLNSCTLYQCIAHFFAIWTLFNYPSYPICTLSTFPNLLRNHFGISQGNLISC